MKNKRTTAASSKKLGATKKTSVQSSPRRLKRPNYQTFKKSKRIKHPDQLPSAYNLFKKALTIFKANWKLFLTITVIYGLLTIILVRGFGGALNLSELKSSLKNGFNGSYASLLTGVTLFSYLLGSAGSSASPTGGVYETLLIIIVSLAVIWALREVLAGHKIRARDAFYRGMYPLIPFILVLVVVGLQLLPLAIGSWLYSTVISNGIAVTVLEKFVWLLMAFLLAILSLYMICSSLFALYIVTLPSMTPLKALRSARQLVLHRRWTVLRKILFLPLAVIILGGVIMIPLIVLVTPAAEWIFFMLSMFTLVVVHAYMYTLYRQLL